MINYKEDINKITSMVNQYSRKYNKIANIKMLTVCGGLLLFLFSFFEKFMVGYILVVGCVLFYIYLMLLHNRIGRDKEYHESKLSVTTKRFDRLNHRWHGFEQKGIEFLGDDSEVEKDLDIFGDNSLYQYLCAAHTIEGKKILAKYLTEEKPDINLIKEKQDAVKELIEQHDFGLELETLCALNNKENKDNKNEWYYSFLGYLKRETPLITKVMDVCSIIIPIISFILLYFIFKGMIRYEVIIPFLAFQISMAYYAKCQSMKEISKVYQFCMSIDNIVGIIKHLEGAQFTSAYLKNMQRKLIDKGSATSAVEKLNHLNEAFLIQQNPYIHVFLQLLFMYDVHCIRLLENWKKRYAVNLEEIFQVIGEMEALLSLSMLGINRNICYPSIDNGSEPVLEGTEMYHPLIDYNEVVANSIRSSSGIEIITGSNMSGKTTFMRTIGINVVLAYAGAPVFAKNMKLSIMMLFTSMRIKDDVTKGISSFYAEVLRMKHIVEYSKCKKPMLVLIDEIFKGTNSADRIVGAQEILKQLNRSYIIAFVSTHDFELCKLVEDKEVKGSNYHFMEHYQGDVIIFDYKLKIGRCKTTNAKHILRMAGLL